MFGHSQFRFWEAAHIKISISTANGTMPAPTLTFRASSLQTELAFRTFRIFDEKSVAL